MKKVRCLFIEDSHIDVEILDWELKKRNILLDYTIVETEEELNMALLDCNFDMIVSDHNMPCLDAVTAFVKCRKMVPDIPFVVFSIFIPKDVLNVLKSNKVSAIIGKYDVEALYQYILQIAKTNKI